MKIIILNSENIPIYKQIADQIKYAIVSGEVGVGEYLPSIRGLAAELGISVITTRNAYDELLNSGFISSRAGKGFYVNECKAEKIRSEGLKKAEEMLKNAVNRATQSGITKDEMFDILKRIYEE